jgi:uncharacterized repeat protein (TIGR04076 family)
MAAKEYEVTIKLVSNKQPCHSGLKIGQEWKYDFAPPPSMCPFAYNSIFPFALVMKTGGTFPWQQDPDVVIASCPDGEVVNTFEIRRRLKK